MQKESLDENWSNKIIAGRRIKKGKPIYFDLPFLGK